MHDPQLFIYSFRFFPQALRKSGELPQVDAYLDKLNQQIADDITSTGFAFIMTSKVKGHIVIRLSICSHRTTLQDIELVFEKLQEIGNHLYERTSSDHLLNDNG